MLRITHTKNAAGAAKYFEEGLQRADYYSTEEQSIGAWGGKAAARLGLEGEVKKEDFIALCHNQKPDGTKLNPRNSDRRKVGYDFTFSVPKSVSIAYAVKGDDRIRQAFEQSVEETMREIERTGIGTLVGQGKDKINYRTGEMIWGSFTHRTSRPVDGIPDPHLHRHCFAINTTWNEKEGRFQAAEFGDIKRTAPYYEAAFLSRMANRMEQIGYQVERRGYSWEIQGIEDETIRKFSRRTEQIEQKAKAEEAKKGFLTEKQKEQLGALTRAKKLVGKSWDKLKQIWRSWLSSSEADQLARADQLAVKKKNEVSAFEAVNRAQQHLFERKSVVKDYQLKAEALKRSYGDVLPEQVQATIDQGDFHQREVNGQHYVTTLEAVEEEYKMLKYIREGRGKEFPLNAGYEPKAEYLNDEQRTAIKHALNDVNQVTIIAGGAGTGKTTLMKEVRDGIEARGKKVIGFAPSAAASRGVLRSEGFKDADTLAQLFHNPKMQEKVAGQVIWVDEAGLIGNKDMNRLFEIAKQQKARILLTGDYRQHASVAAGDALRIMEQEAGIKVARVRKIQRQRNNGMYKWAVSLAAEGRTDAALYKLDNMGDVKEITDGKERLTQLVEDYVHSTKQGKTALIVSPTHIEGRNVTETLRDKLKEEGQLLGSEKTFLRLKNNNWTEENKTDPFHYQGQDLTLEFHQNAKGHVRGERWQIEGTPREGSPPLPQLHSIAATGQDGKEQQIDLKQADRFTVYRQEEIRLAKGDRIRITKGSKTREGTRINNGDMFTVAGFTRDGHIKLNTGKTLDKEFGHLTHGYVTTSHSSQGKTVDHVFIAQSSQSVPASSQQQFYVSISRGREQCRIYTDDKRALEQAVKRDGQRMTARQVANQKIHAKLRSGREEINRDNELQNKIDHGRGKSL